MCFSGLSRSAFEERPKFERLTWVIKKIFVILK